MIARQDIQRALSGKPGALIDAHTHVGVCLAGYVTEGYPYCQSASDVHGKLSSLGFDFWVTFPMPTPIVFDLDGYRNCRLEPSSCASATPFEFENRRLMVEVYELLDDLSDRFACMAAVDPERRPAEQVESLTSLARDYPVCGLKVMGTAIRSHAIALLSEGACLLDWAAERDLPVVMHSAVHSEDPWSAVDDLLRVAEARPGLRFCVAHAARFDRPALDRIAELDNCWFDTSAFGIHCELAVSNHDSAARPDRRFPADYARPDEALAGIAGTYPNKTIYGSDAPFESYAGRHRHADGRIEKYSLRGDLAKETGYLRSLPADVVRRISYENTMRFLFGADVESV